jgi:hypothetical protein
MNSTPSPKLQRATEMAWRNAEMLPEGIRKMCVAGEPTFDGNVQKSE